MTVIAIRKYKNHIEMAADSQTTWGDHKILKASKLTKVNGMYLGCAGAVSESSLLKIFSRNHKPKAANDDDVLDFLSEFADWKEKKTKKYDIENSVLLVMEQKIFHVLAMSVRDVDSDFFAIGSGMFLALGAMELGASPMTGVAIAIKHDVYCGGEIRTINIDGRNL